jgi:hypothetical protein
MNIKKILSCVGALVLCCGLVVTPQVADISNALVASADDEEYIYSGSCGKNATFEFDESTGTLTISGTGDMENYHVSILTVDGKDEVEYKDTPWYAYEDKIKSLVVQDGIISINSGFEYCTSLESVTLSNDITSIDGVFYGCTSLKNITIPNSVTSIGDFVFVNCTSLESIAIPNSVTRIGYAAFLECTSLKNITIPSVVTHIDGSAFEGCTSLESITIPNGVTSIGKRTFQDCTSLESIDIPNSITSISSYAFEECISLTDVYFQGTEEEWNSIEIGDDNAALLNATIHFLGSTAQEETTTGDLNGDGEVNALDLLAIKRSLLGIDETSNAGDINGDGAVNVVDLLTLKRYILGIITTLE